MADTSEKIQTTGHLPDDTGKREPTGLGQLYILLWIGKDIPQTEYQTLYITHFYIQQTKCIMS